MECNEIDDSMSGSINVMKGLGFLEAGDTVYYKAPRPDYAVRKSVVVEVVTAPPSSSIWRVMFQHYVYVLANGERLKQWDAYATRSLAEAALIEDLKSSIAFKKVQQTNLQHEIAYEEEALRLIEKSKLAN